MDSDLLHLRIPECVGVCVCVCVPVAGPAPNVHENAVHKAYKVQCNAITVMQLMPVVLLPQTLELLTDAYRIAVHASICRSWQYFHARASFENRTSYRIFIPGTRLLPYTSNCMKPKTKVT